MASLPLIAAVAALMLLGVNRVDAKASKYLVETKDDMEPPVMPPVYPVDPFPLPPTLPVPDDLENEIANKLANKLRAAGSRHHPPPSSVPTLQGIQLNACNPTTHVMKCSRRQLPIPMFLHYTAQDASPTSPTSIPPIHCNEV